MLVLQIRRSSVCCCPAPRHRTPPALPLPLFPWQCCLAKGCCTGTEELPHPEGVSPSLSLQKRGEAVATQSMGLKDLLLRVCTSGFWEQKSSNPHTLRALTMGGLAQLGCRDRQDRDGRLGTRPGTCAVNSASHKTAFLPSGDFLR